MWDPKVYPHSLKEELSSGFFYDTLLAVCHDGHLRESVDDHENTIIYMLNRRKVGHVIHGDKFQRPGRSRQRSVQALLLDVWFGNVTGGVGSNVLLNILMKFRPIKTLFQYCHCFLYSEMSSDPTIVLLPNHLGTFT